MKKKTLFENSALKSEELNTIKSIQENFENSKLGIHEKLENFPNWVRHRDLARFILKYEIYKSILNIPGSIMECGVLYGGGVSTWLHLGEIFEPVNYGRKVFAFDTFSGFPEITDEDLPVKKIQRIANYIKKEHIALQM